MPTLRVHSLAVQMVPVMRPPTRMRVLYGFDVEATPPVSVSTTKSPATVLKVYPTRLRQYVFAMTSALVSMV